MRPSITACATCTPCGPNSRARDWLRARSANFPAEKAENWAEAFKDAVAPDTINDGGCCELGVAWRSNGRVFCAKTKNESLFVHVSGRRNNLGNYHVRDAAHGKAEFLRFQI
jgi:hypothetical protein